MHLRRPSRGRTFLALGSVSVVLATSLVYAAYRSADGVVLIHGHTLPMLALGAGFIGGGIADLATDGGHRPLRMGLASVAAFLGAILYPVVSAVASGSIERMAVLPFVGGYVTWGLALAVVTVVSVEVLVWENRGRPR